MKTRQTLLTLAAILLALAPSAQADDRDFVRTSAEDPYFFVIFDVSGSMNWTGAEVGCANGDCIAPMSGDDPRSKFYQAKKAIYEALEGADNVNFGYATYNQDSLRVKNKHFRYVALDDGPSLSGTPNAFPVVGAVETFGPAFSPFCDNGGGDNNIGCYDNWPADLNDSSSGYWERERVRRLPKPTPTNYFYVRTSNGTRYRLRYAMANGTQVGEDTVDVLITRRRCSGPSDECYNNGTTTKVVQFRRQALTVPPPAPGEDPIFDEFLHWDNGVRRNLDRRGYFSQGQSADMGVSNTCAGWDPNTDSNSDDYNNAYNIRHSTVAGPDDPALTYGDVIPLSWSDDHKDDILSRFAPTPGVYGAAPYFEDFRSGGRNYLRLKDPNLRPTVPHGSTPLAKSMRDFRDWVLTWSSIASGLDPDFGCRQKYLLLITDGADTCGGADECAMATALRNQGFLTYVIGFGLTGGPATSLNCIATNGGTGAPLLPQDGDALRDAITDILNQVNEQTRSFATAAVPSADASSDDTIYLTNFTPVSTDAIWNGRLDAFLKPVPLTVDSLPDTSIDCGGTLTAACHLWDAGEEILNQAPTPADVTGGDFKLGLAASQRRLFYPKADSSFRLFEPPTNPLDWPQLLIDFGFDDTNPANPLVLGRAVNIMAETVVIKQFDIPVDPNFPMGPSITIDYVLGDVFHSNPAILQNPNNFNRFALNLFTTGQPCDLTATSDRGYRCFAAKTNFRRRSLIAGSNDGQLHVFNAGIIDSSTLKFDNGDGSETFAYIPRMALPIIRDAAEGTTHTYGVDGPVTLADVYIHPRVGSIGPVDPDEREWRTVIVGGLREGGLKIGGDIVQKPETGAVGARDILSGYYALDVTQPDPLSIVDPGTDRQRFIPDTDPIPGCLTVDGTIPAGCGPMPYPALLWEFQDLNPASGEPMDEDPVPNGFADLGQTWTQPIIVALRVIEGGAVVTKNVALVGGGLDPDNKTSANPNHGNWIYMIDIETGRAIYKRRVLGSVPDLNALDSDLDDHVDAIYAGTTAGILYKIDVSVPQPIESPLVPPVDVLGIPDPGAERVYSSQWDPFPIFETYNNLPIYVRPQLVFVGRLGRFSIAFGTGDRQDLWNETAEHGRFYLLLDPGFLISDGSLPFDETELHGFAAGDPPLLVGGAPPNLLTNPELVDVNNRPGWYMTWEPDERLITVPFAFSGVLIFNSFQPDVIQLNPGDPANVACARTGISGTFIIRLENGNALVDLDQSDADIDRVSRSTGFKGAPFVDRATTSNQGGSGGAGGGGGGGGGSGGGGGGTLAGQCRNFPELSAMVDAFIQDKAGSGSKFGNYLYLVTQPDELGAQYVGACIPIAVKVRNWKEN